MKLIVVRPFLIVLTIMAATENLQCSTGASEVAHQKATVEALGLTGNLR